MENYAHVAPLIDSGKVIVTPTYDDYVQVGERDILGLVTHRFYHWDLAHMITNVSPVLRDSVNNHYIITTGDFTINRQPTPVGFDAGLAMMRDYIDEVLFHAEIPSSATVEFYFNIGHFPEYLQIYPWLSDSAEHTPIDTVKQYMREQFPDYTKLEIIPIHLKTTDGWDLWLHSPEIDLDNYWYYKYREYFNFSQVAENGRFSAP